MKLPNLSEIIELANSDYEKKFLAEEFGLGVEYYLSRIDQLMLRGGAVLDAGCGAGQWSFALAHRFQRVAGIDVSKERLNICRTLMRKMEIVNLHLECGSIEALPYKDICFDAIVCYGVIMLTNAAGALREFFRVLRPGGRVYICLNADGWSDYLIHGRGADDDRVRAIGSKTLYATYWARAIESGFFQEMKSQYVLVNGILDDVAAGRPTLPGDKLPTATIARRLLDSTSSARRLHSEVSKNCGPACEQTLVDHVAAVIEGKEIKPEMGAVRAYQPDEFHSIAAAAGFAEFQWSTEGGLLCDWTRPPLASKYPGHFNGRLSVWECLLVKPGCEPPPVSISAHIKLALEAQQKPVYVEAAPAPIVSNASVSTFPRHLFRHCHFLGESMGGEKYLKAIALRITEGARNESEAAEGIIAFVQKALFRDPVAQPLRDDGGIPDSLTILLCARGRCSHASHVVADLCRHSGIDARLRQLRRHIVTEVHADGRWIIADADAFKFGVVPRNKDGRLLTMEEIESYPFQLDRYPTTGWMIRPGSPFTKGVMHREVKGYVDALEQDQRGYLSGYYVPAAEGYPPSIPVITKCERRGKNGYLEWRPSVVAHGRVVGYRVHVGTNSRGWNYSEASGWNRVAQALPADVAALETSLNHLEFPLPDSAALFTSVTAFSDRIELEPETYFWPSEELTLDRTHN